MLANSLSSIIVLTVYMRIKTLNTSSRLWLLTCRAYIICPKCFAGFELVGRNGFSCRRKKRRCDEKRALRARRDADASDGPAKKQIHQAMSGQQRAARRGWSSPTGRSSARPSRIAEDRAVRRRQSAQHLHGQHRPQQCATRPQRAGGRLYRHLTTGSSATSTSGSSGSSIGSSGGR